MKLKYSKQRESIKLFVMSRKDHPTADMVYTHLRDEYPNISLGTVYRNLSLLADLGELQRINCGDGVDHFDADTSSHCHIHCDVCGCLHDLHIPNALEFLSTANDLYDGVVTSQVIHFNGTCAQCLTQNKK